MTDAAIIYRSHMEAIENLPEDQQLSALKAIVYYCMEDTIPTDGIASCVLMMAKPVLDKWKIKREAGRKGGEADRKQTESKPEAKEREKEKVKDIKEKSTLTSAKRERFTPPSADEVQEYCTERQNGISGAEFVDFYASKGWKIGKEPMKDWKAAVRTWERKRKEARSSPRRPIQNFTGRTGDDKSQNDELKRRILELGA